MQNSKSKFKTPNCQTHTDSQIVKDQIVKQTPQSNCQTPNSQTQTDSKIVKHNFHSPIV